MPPRQHEGPREEPSGPLAAPPAPVAPALAVERTLAETIARAMPRPIESADTLVAAPAQRLVRAAPAARVFAPPPRAAAAAPAPAAATASREEHPAVRVHIGRLEVRANLQQAPPPDSPRRDPAPPAGPSLSDYLRGGSDAR